MTHKWKDLHDKDNVIFLKKYEKYQGYVRGFKAGFWRGVVLTAVAFMLLVMTVIVSMVLLGIDLAINI